MNAGLPQSFLLQGEPPHDDFRDRIPPCPQMDAVLRNIKRKIRETTGLRELVLGYIKLDEDAVDDNWDDYASAVQGHVILHPFSQEYVAGFYDQIPSVFLCYVGAAVDDDDDFVEDERFDPDNFDAYVSGAINGAYVLSCGSFAHGAHGRVRAFKFIMGDDVGGTNDVPSGLVYCQDQLERAAQLMARGSMAESRRIVDAMKAACPYSGRALELSACLLMRQGKWDAAELEFGEAIEVHTACGDFVRRGAMEAVLELLKLRPETDWDHIKAVAQIEQRIG